MWVASPAARLWTEWVNSFEAKVLTNCCQPSGELQPRNYNGHYEEHSKLDKDHLKSIFMLEGFPNQSELETYFNCHTEVSKRPQNSKQHP